MPKKLNKLYFGPAGVPNSSPKKDTLTGIKTVKELELDAMELEFVYGVKLKPDIVKIIGNLSKELEILLTSHAPYYINLNAKEKTKIKKSIKMIVDSAKITYRVGGWSVCFHPGWYLKKPREDSYRCVKEALKSVIHILKEENIDVWIRPETMEALTKFGDLEEVIKLSQEIEGILPCIDFAHLRYRYGKNSEDFYRNILETIENELGREALDNMHMHMSGIKLDKKGTHVNLKESDILWEDILRLLKEFKVKGIVISESPNLEEDAIMMKKYYQKLKE